MIQVNNLAEWNQNIKHKHEGKRPEFFSFEYALLLLLVLSKVV